MVIVPRPKSRQLYDFVIQVTFVCPRPGPTRCPRRRGMRNGRPVRYSGLVICRHQLATTKGVTGILQAQQGTVHLVGEHLWPL